VTFSRLQRHSRCEGESVEEVVAVAAEYPGSGQTSDDDDADGERAELLRLEQAIALSMKSFAEVGGAFREINAMRLFRAAGYRTFGEYAESRWGVSRSYAYRQMQAAQVVAILEDSDDVPPPKNEAQARELLRLAHESDVLRCVWRDAIAASGARLTAQRLRRRVDAELRATASCLDD
jgi:hypothetical protein